jgi:hypothetical protein
MLTFTCNECNTDGIVVTKADGGIMVSPCDCVANTNK